MLSNIQLPPMEQQLDKYNNKDENIKTADPITGNDSQSDSIDSYLVITCLKTDATNKYVISV
jgi:hypothetical protein